MIRFLGNTGEIKRAIVTDGGAYKTIGQLGAIEAIMERCDGIDYWHGVSGGALNAAKFVESGFNEKSLNELKEVWLHVQREGPKILFSKWASIKTALSLFRSSSLYPDKGLEHVLSFLADPVKIVESPTRFDVGVHNYNRNDYQVFSNHDPRFKENPADFLKVLKASCSVHGAFPPVELFGEYYGDGLKLSLEMPINAGCNVIFALIVRHSRKYPDPLKASCLNHLMDPFDILLDNYYSAILDKFKKHEEMPSPFVIIPIKLHENNNVITSSYFRKGGNDFEKAIQAAYDHTNKILDEWKI